MFDRKNIRLESYAYHSDGYYFVTIVSRLRLSLLAGLEGLVQNIFSSAVSGIHGVRIDTLVVMPNHIHMIIHMQNARLHLGQVVRRMKAKTSYELGQSVWQANYYEHIIRSEESLGLIREYIRQNPEMERIKIMEQADKSARYDNVGMS